MRTVPPAHDPPATATDSEATLLATFHIHAGDGSMQGHVELHPKKTILVGRNAAGKSWILEGLRDGCRLGTVGVSEQERAAKSFQFTFQTKDGSVNALFETAQSQAPAQHSDTAQRSFGLRERVQTGDGLTLLAAAEGKGSIGGMTVLLGDQRRSLLGADIELPENLAWLRTFFRSFRFIRPGVPRREERETVYLELDPIQRVWRSSKWVPERIGKLAATIANWSETDPTQFQRFAETTRKVGLASHLQLRAMEIEPGKKTIGVVLADNVELGHLSDGTLRIMEVLVPLVDPAAALVVIEEPETSIHPALLQKLLNEIESLGYGKQIILSTHSPQVVSAARPEELRMVRWTPTGPVVSRMTDAQVADLLQFLEDEGSFGDFVFEGGLEGEE